MSEKLTNSERWCLTKEVDGVESLVGSKALRIIDAQAATLERVRASFATWCGVGGIEGPVDTLDSIGVALASQPEAPAKPVPWHVAEQRALLAAMAWHRLDTSVNTEALHHYCAEAIKARGSQPEAPRAPNTYEVWRGTEKRKDEVVLETQDIELAARTACADLSGQTFWGMKRQPEAPKGQGATEEARNLADIRLADALTATAERLEAANARIAELEESERKACRLVREIAQERDDSQRRDLERLAAVAGARDAANARAVEWEQIAEQRHRDILDLTTDNTKQRREAEDANARIAELENVSRRPGMTKANLNLLLDVVGRERDTATARADAAERALTVNAHEYGERYSALETERDQLAARVKELEVNGYRLLNGEQLCTPEERAVLEECREMRLEEEDADDEPGEPVEVGEDCYIYTDDQHAIVRAELANRAAKAKREAK